MSCFYEWKQRRLLFSIRTQNCSGDFLLPSECLFFGTYESGHFGAFCTVSWKRILSAWRMENKSTCVSVGSFTFLNFPGKCHSIVCDKTLWWAVICLAEILVTSEELNSGNSGFKFATWRVSFYGIGVWHFCLDFKVGNTKNTCRLKLQFFFPQNIF